MRIVLKCYCFSCYGQKHNRLYKRPRGASVYMQYKIRVMGNNLSVQLGVMLAVYDLSPVKDLSFKAFTLPSRNQG